jgi:hypothetical protein
MLTTTMTEFFKVLPPRICTNCKEELVEMADCYKMVCVKCDGSIFYPLSPLNQMPKAIPYA